MQAATPGPLASNIVVDVRGGKSIKIPLKGTAYVPEIDVLEDEFDFGEAFFGSTVRRPLSLKNATAVGASMRVDLRAHPQFTIELPRGNWNSKLYDTCPLVEAEIAQRQVWR